MNQDISTQLLEQTKDAIANKTPLRIQGNNTKAHLGRETTNEQTIKLNEHAGIIEYNPVELVMTVRAGTRLDTINAALEEHGQMLACDPAQYNGAATIGGSLASDQAGHARPWLGSLRDHTLGIRLINGHGEHLRFGGQVMKNVAGYDVSRLQAGAMGTLGIMTEISFKVLPKPASHQSLYIDTDSQQAITLMRQLASQAKPLTGLSWHKHKLWIRLQGAQSAVEASAKQWQKQYSATEADDTQAMHYWQALREHQLDSFQQALPLWRFSVNPAAPAILTEDEWVFNWAGAQRWLKGDYTLDTLTELAAQQGGEVQLYSGRKNSNERHLIKNDALKKLLQNTKQALDPQGIFNPGRLYSWL